MLKLLRDWLAPPKPPLPSVLPVLAEIDDRNLSLSTFVYGGPQSGYATVPRRYSVSITHKAEGIECKADGEGETFDEALTIAWAKWPSRSA